MFLIRSGAIDGFDRVVRRLGQNPIELLEEGGFSPAQLRDPNTYVSYTKMADLLEMAAVRCQEPLLGLTLALEQNTMVLGDLALTMFQYDDLETILHKLNKYVYIHAAGVQLDPKPAGEFIQLEYHFVIESLYGLQQLTLLSMGQFCNFLRDTMAIESREILLHLAQPESASKLNSPMRINYNAPHNLVQFPRSWMKLKPQLNPQAMETLQQHFNKLLHSLEQNYPDNLANQVKVIIGQLLPSSECNIQRVATHLDLHPRVLQKRLKQQNVSFSQLLRETRQQIAEQYLQHSRLSITELSLYLGYSDTAVFSRNFREWTGLSPRQWRQSRGG